MPLLGRPVLQADEHRDRVQERDADRGGADPPGRAARAASASRARSRPSPRAGTQHEPGVGGGVQPLPPQLAHLVDVHRQPVCGTSRRSSRARSRPRRRRRSSRSARRSGRPPCRSCAQTRPARDCPRSASARGRSAPPAGCAASARRRRRCRRSAPRGPGTRRCPSVLRCRQAAIALRVALTAGEDDRAHRGDQQQQRHELERDQELGQEQLADLGR